MKLTTLIITIDSGWVTFGVLPWPCCAWENLRAEPSGWRSLTVALSYNLFLNPVMKSNPPLKKTKLNKTWLWRWQMTPMVPFKKLYKHFCQHIGRLRSSKWWTIRQIVPIIRLFSRYGYSFQEYPFIIPIVGLIWNVKWVKRLKCLNVRHPIWCLRHDLNWM